MQVHACTAPSVTAALPSIACMPPRTPPSQECRYVSGSSSGGCYDNDCTDMVAL